MLQFQELTAAQGDCLRRYYEACAAITGTATTACVNIPWASSSCGGTTCIRPLPRSPAAL